MEIAIRPEMHTYSGGLGVLAGDTARSGADLELPMVFVTLLEPTGYLHQEFDAAGHQVEQPDPWNPPEWCAPAAASVAITMEGRDGLDAALALRLQLARCRPVPVFLLDTDLDQNHPADRQITDRLYGGDDAYRLKQEVSARHRRPAPACGRSASPCDTYHLNEGHAALLTLELLTHYPRQTDMTRARADRATTRPGARASCLFTTHTPVEAGHDRFHYDLVEQLLGELIDIDEIKRYAGENDCNMTRLALNLSGFVNGVADAPRRDHAAHVPRLSRPRHHQRRPRRDLGDPDLRQAVRRAFPGLAHEPELLVHADHSADDEICAGARGRRRRT